MKRSFFLLMFLAITGQAFSQHNVSQQSYLNLADSLFRYQNYQSATTYYQRAIKNSNNPGEIMLQLANCYNKMNQAEEAEKWFKKAKKEGALFSNSDTYRFADVLIKLQEREEAVEILTELLKEDPEANYARLIVDDIHNMEKYYRDSTDWKIEPLSFNTDVSEFSPQYYKDGIVFSSAQPKNLLEKKYHWDGSHFLNLFYSKRIEGSTFDDPELFDDELNSQYHDGPVSFYSNYEKMILNRNHQAQVGDENKMMMWHLSLFDAEKNQQNGGWNLSNLPFADPPYFYAHPSISESGNTLYFVSNMEGGFGGTDIYRIQRKNGKWGKPVNLGPQINTHKNEVFPYFVKSTLYFASDGLGGLGGLDIFKCTLNENEFSDPINLGYPVNSSADDFSFITTENEESGYFSSARSGNDDIYIFYQEINVRLLAHVFNGKTNDPIPNADLQIATLSNDFNLNSDTAGNAFFDLLLGTAYVLIADNGSKTGMSVGVAEIEEGYEFRTQMVPMFGDTSQVPVLSNKADLGIDERDSIVSIKSIADNQDIDFIQNKGVVGFLSPGGEEFLMEIQRLNGDKFNKNVSLVQVKEDPDVWTIESNDEGIVQSIAHFFRLDDGEPVDSAKVELITFSESDQNLVTGQEGNVNFSLSDSSVFLLVGTKGNLSGMYNGIVDTQSDSTYDTLRVGLTKVDANQLPVAGKITDENGYLLDEVIISVTEEPGGDSLEVQLKKGVFSFFGEKGKSYTINVEHPDYQPKAISLSVPNDDTGAKKLAITLDDGIVNLVAHVFHFDSENAVDSANVDLVTFSESDQTFISDLEGNVNFSLSEGAIFLLFATKDDLSGMYTGIADAKSGESFMTHLLPLTKGKENHVPLGGLITNSEGHMLDKVTVQVIEEPNGDTIAVQVVKGVFCFFGEKGRDYTIHIDHKEYQHHAEIISIPTGNTNIEKVEIVLTDPIGTGIDMLAHMYKSEGEESVAGAVVELTTFEGPDENFTSDEDGNVNFSLLEGEAFLLVAVKDDLSGMYTGIVDAQSGKAFMTHRVALGRNKENQLPVAGKITDENGYLLDEVIINVTEEPEGNSLEVQSNKGVFSFFGEKGKHYTIEVAHSNYQSLSKVLSIPLEETKAEKLIFSLEKAGSIEGDDRVMTTALITDVQGELLNNPNVVVREEATGEEVVAEFDHGTLQFDGEKGKTYLVEANHPNYKTASALFTIPVDGSTTDEISMTLEKDEDFLLMSARIFKEIDDAPLGDADIKILSSEGKDIELVADSNGLFDFALPKESVYLITGSKDGFIGMYYGMAEKGTDKASQIHQVPTHKEEGKKQVVGLVQNKYSMPIEKADIQVIDSSTDDSVAVEISKGLLAFKGEQGKTYALKVNAVGYEPFEQAVRLDTSSESTETIRISLNYSIDPLSQNSTLIVLNSDRSSSKFYILSDGLPYEVIGSDAKLYLKDSEKTKVFANGTIEEFKRQPQVFLAKLGITDPEIISLQNIYFDYNSSNLSADSKKELEKAAKILQENSYLQLIISAHADDRGKENYNQKLSMRRANSVQSFLTSAGVAPDMMVAEAFGESKPVIPCQVQNCDENDHSKNRRAELSLRLKKPAVGSENSLVSQDQSEQREEEVIIEKEKDKLSYAEIIEQYGEKRVDGLAFKISVGAYRYNPDLTFDELHDLGTIRKKLVDGINYYFLEEFYELKTAEKMRKEVVNRGIEDAFISIYYHDEIIPFKTYLTLVESESSLVNQ